jgi:hypothetical protein
MQHNERKNTREKDKGQIAVRTGWQMEQGQQGEREHLQWVNQEVKRA